MSEYREGRAQDFPLYKPFLMSCMPETVSFHLPVTFSYVILIIYPSEYALVSKSLFSVCVYSTVLRSRYMN